MTTHTLPPNSHFTTFAAALRDRFQSLAANHELFQTGVTGDEMWAAYLASFPEGTNPIFRKRPHFDGSTDRSVIRRIGNVVALVNGSLESVWDFPSGSIPFPFDVVSRALRDAALSKPLTEIYLSDIAHLGCVSNVERLENGDTLTWNHLHATVPNMYVKPGSYAEIRGQWRTDIGVFRRALDEIPIEALDTIVELIEGKSLYRGDQYEKAVRAFREHKVKWEALRSVNGDLDLYLIANYKDRMSVDFRNSAIGSLAKDLADNRTLESAVASFHVKVAPGNYRHSKAPITSGMIDKAMATLRTLDLEPALERRHAQIGDVTINNVIWADRAAASQMKGGIEALLKQDVAGRDEGGKAIEITEREFRETVVPNAVSMEVKFEDAHVGNLVSLTAPVHAGVERLFQWDNNFGWSYNGNVTDSIRERVKAAGGDVNAIFRVSLSWFNTDDLDLHAFIRPSHGSKPIQVSFANPMDILDVDMNRPHSALSRTPVENMAFRRLLVGEIDFIVHNYQKRETSDVGFELQVDIRGQIEHLRYPQGVQHREQVHVFTYRLSEDGSITRIGVNKSLASGLRSQDHWGIKTNTYVPVMTLLDSPNFWDGQSNGNRHLFFVLKDCKNDAPVRGIYNEFLRAELHEHRKVFEVLADKTKCAVSDQQLSGLGFSSTIRNHVTVKVFDGTTTRRYNVNF